MKEIYRKMHSNEFVYKEDAEDYAMDHLGIEIKPIGKDGEYTQEQIDFMGEFTEWYFSGDWYQDVKEEE